MSGPLVSVIMPVCNPGGYLRPAVDSVLAQTLSDFELLLVDDGSTDGSGAVCDEYAARDPRVRVKHGRNGGICASRNAGLDLARGEWLAFCDHDDHCHADWLSVMLEAARREKVPVVKCAHEEARRLSDGRVCGRFVPARRPDCRWRSADFAASDGYRLYRDVGTLMWDGLYSAEMWRKAGLRFDESFRFGGEDIYLSVDLLKAAGEGFWIGRPLYVHYLNEGVSTSSRFHLELLDDYDRVARHEAEVFPFSDTGHSYARFAWWSRMLFSWVFRAPGNTVGFARQVRILTEWYDRIMNGRKVSCADLPCSWRRRFGVFFSNRRLFGAYLLSLYLQELLTWRR